MSLNAFTHRLLKPWRTRPMPSSTVPPIYFMHIPKTAGSTLGELLSSRFPGDACLQQRGRQELWTEDVNRYQFVAGHGDFRIAEQFKTPPTIITCLRNPVDRALSFYYFSRQSYSPERLRRTYASLGEDLNSASVQEALRRADLVRRLTLSDVVQNHPDLAEEYLGNWQTKCLAGNLSGSPTELLSQALENLERCDIIGLTERLRDSVDLLCRQLGWEPYPEIPRINVTRKRKAVDELDSETHECLRKLLAPDIAVYEAAQQLFEQRWQAMSRQPETQCDRSASLPDPSNYSFGEALFGTGFYPRVKRDDTWIRWTGPSAESWIDLRSMPAANCEFRCDLLHRVPNDVLRSVQLRINGELVPLQVHQSPKKQMLTADVPHTAIAADPSRIRVHFTVNQRWRPCDLNPASDDNRWLGICIRQLSLRKRRSWFRAA